MSDLLRDEGASAEVQLAGLIHDSSEAYLGDLIAPLKHRPEFHFFREIEDHVLTVIAETHGLAYPFPPEVHAADRTICALEILFRRDVANACRPAADEQEFLLRWTDLVVEWATDRRK